MSDDFGQVPRDPFAATSPAGQPMPPMGPGGQQKSWFARNWWWFLALVLGLPFCLCCSCCGGFVWLGYELGNNNEAYKQSVSIVETSPRVQQMFGTPLEVDFPRDFQSSTLNGVTHASVEYDVRGPNGSGWIYAEGDDSSGSWQFVTLDLYRDAGGRVIDLLASETQGDAEGVQDAASDAAGDGG